MSRSLPRSTLKAARLYIIMPPSRASTVILCTFSLSLRQMCPSSRLRPKLKHSLLPCKLLCKLLYTCRASLTTSSPYLEFHSSLCEPRSLQGRHHSQINMSLQLDSRAHQHHCSLTSQSSKSSLRTQQLLYSSPLTPFTLLLRNKPSTMSSSLPSRPKRPTFHLHRPSQPKLLRFRHQRSTMCLDKARSTKCSSTRSTAWRAQWVIWQ